MLCCKYDYITLRNLNHPNPPITKSCRQEANDDMLTSTTKAASVSLSVQDLGNPEKKGSDIE